MCLNCGVIGWYAMAVVSSLYPSHCSVFSSRHPCHCSPSLTLVTPLTLIATFAYSSIKRVYTVCLYRGSWISQYRDWPMMMQSWSSRLSQYIYKCFRILVLPCVQANDDQHNLYKENSYNKQQ